MNCRSTVEMLSAYLDRELGPVERDAVRAHLANCDRCRADERELRSLKGLLLGVRAPEPTVGFEGRLMRRLHAEAARPMPRRLAIPPIRPLVFGQLGGLAMAAALVIVVASHEPRPVAVRPVAMPAAPVAVVQVDDEKYAQHSEAYHLAADNAFGATLLSP